jgi:hypothetical protein
MAWVKFHSEHWWSPTPGVDIRYPEGSTHNVPEGCAKDAVAKGAGKRTTVKTRAAAAKVKATSATVSIEE